MASVMMRKIALTALSPSAQRRGWHPSRLIPLALVAVSVAPLGCLSLVGIEQGMVVITQAFQTTSAGQGCIAGGTAIAQGALDVENATGYVAALDVRTNLPATFTTQNIQQDRNRSPNFPNYGNSDSNIVDLREAVVFITDADNGDDIVNLPTAANPRRQAATGVIFNEQTNLGNSALVHANAISDLEAQLIRDGAIGNQLIGQPGSSKTLIANIQFAGMTAGGGLIETNIFSFPIRVCRGCVYVTCAPGEQRQPGDTCAIPGQDVPFTCVAP